MGANQSSRNITVVNDEATGVIKISDSVVNRLKGEMGGEKGGDGGSGQKAAPPPKQPKPAMEQPPPQSHAPTEVAQPVEHPQQGGQVWQRPIIQYIEEPSLSSLRVRQEKEEEMKVLEDYWQKRLKKQQDDHAAMTGLTEKEVDAGVKKVEGLFLPAAKRALCRAERDAVKDCYKTHPSQPLRCKEVVKNFVSCVNTGTLPTAG